MSPQRRRAKKKKKKRAVSPYVVPPRVFQAECALEQNKNKKTKQNKKNLTKPVVSQKARITEDRLS